MYSNLITMKKICTTCNIEKNLTDYRRDKTKNDGRQSYCSVCARSRISSRYDERYSTKTRDRNSNKRAEFNQHLTEYKSNRSCLICPESDPCCLEFHHKDPTQKEFTIARNRMKSWDQVLIEIEKCVILCSNCHHKYHAGRFKL